MNITASNCKCGLAWEHTGRHANSTNPDCAYCEPDRWARQLSERGSTVPVCAQHRLSPRPRLGECDQKDLEVKDDSDIFKFFNDNPKPIEIRDFVHKEKKKSYDDGFLKGRSYEAKVCEGCGAKGDRLIEMAKEESRLEERNRIIDLIKKLIKEQNKHTDGPIIYLNHSTEKCKKCGFDEGIKYCLEYVCTELKK